MRRVLIIPAVLLVMLAGALLWSGSAHVRPADFTFINRGEIGTLDPKGMSWLQDIRIAYALWEGLCQLDPTTLDAIPGVAETIDQSPDGLTYTFHIRPDARWSNGDPLTSADFMFAWQRSLEQPGEYTYLYHSIVGAASYQQSIAAGDRPNFETVGVKAPDPQTLVVTLKSPVAYFRDLVAFPAFFPLHEPSMRKYAREDPKTGRPVYAAEFTRDKNLVTNGPFRLTEWEFKKQLRMDANEHYWDRESVRSKSIVQISAEDALPAFIAYETGAADWLAEVTGEIAAELLAKQAAGNRKEADLRVFPGFGTYFYSFNCLPTLADGKPNPFADVRVRRAFSMAVDKRTIVDTITRMGEAPAITYIPPDIFAGYASPQGLLFDIDAARNELAAAGFPGGKGFPRLSILYNTGMHHGDLAQNVRRQWEQNLGVTLDLEGVEIKVFRQRLHSQDYAIARASWIGDYNDPSTFTDKYLSYSENNDAKWANREYDGLCRQATEETEPIARLKLLTEAESILLREAPILPVYGYVNAYLFKDDVKGIPLHPRNMVNFKSVYVER